jgi:ribosomal 30S subunit maturation factor RimM
VREVRAYPTVDILVVRAHDGGKDWEVPLVDTFIKSIRLEEELVELHSLEGLERG